MQLKQIDPKALWVWRIRLCGYALLPSFLLALFFSPDRLPWKIATVVWVLAFLAMFVWYYPLKLRKLSYALSEDLLVVYTGVIYTRRKTMLIPNIQYVNLVVLPLQRVFGLCTVYFQAAGGQVHLPGLRLEDGKLLQQLLTPGGEELL